jgi:hypothetical protein
MPNLSFPPKIARQRPVEIVRSAEDHVVYKTFGNADSSRYLAFSRAFKQVLVLSLLLLRTIAHYEFRDFDCEVSINDSRTRTNK